MLVAHDLQEHRADSSAEAHKLLGRKVRNLKESVKASWTSSRADHSDHARRHQLRYLKDDIVLDEEIAGIKWWLSVRSAQAGRSRRKRTSTKRSSKDVSNICKSGSRRVNDASPRRKGLAAFLVAYRVAGSSPPARAVKTRRGAGSLSGVSSVAARRAPPAPVSRPAQLSSPTDSDIFFGRQEHVDPSLSLLRDQQVIAVLGGSGSGKSSVVRAGVIPALTSTYKIEGQARPLVCRRFASQGCSRWTNSATPYGSRSVRPVIESLEWGRRACGRTRRHRRAARSPSSDQTSITDGTGGAAPDLRSRSFVPATS